MKVTALILALLMFSGLAMAQSLPAAGADITESVRGYARIQLADTQAYLYGSGVVQTWRWADGREAVCIFLYQDAKEHPVTPPINSRYSIIFAAQADGSQLLAIQGWGSIEVYSADAKQREAFSRTAPASEQSIKSVECYRLRDGTLEIWIEPISY